MSFSTPADTARRKRTKQELRDTLKAVYGISGAQELPELIGVVLERGLPSRREREAAGKVKA